MGFEMSVFLMSDVLSLTVSEMGVERLVGW